MRLYFDVWDAETPQGTALGELSHAYDKKILDERGFGEGSGEFVINRHDAQAAWCAPGNLVRVRKEAGGPFDWDDPRYRHAFWIEDGTDEAVSPDEEMGEEWHRGGPGILAVLGRLILWNDNFMGQQGTREDGNWHWNNDQYGDIFQRFLEEWNARPAPKPIPQTLTYDFTSGNDSDGVAFPTFDGAFTLPIGATYREATKSLQSQGLEVGMLPDFTAQAWVARGADRHTSVTFRRGWNIREGGTRHVHATPLGTRALVKGTNGGGALTFVEATDSYTSTYEGGRWGRREVFVQYERSASATVLQRAGRAALASLRTQSIGPVTIGVTTRAIDAGAASDGHPTRPAIQDLEPWDDYDVGDTVGLDISGEYANLPIRLVGITIEDGENGDAEVTLDLLGTPFESGQGAASSAGAGMGNGEGTCNCPVPDDCQGRYPGAPTVVDHWSEGTVTGAGSALSGNGISTFDVQGGADHALIAVVFAGGAGQSPDTTDVRYIPNISAPGTYEAFTRISGVDIPGQSGGLGEISAWVLEAPSASDLSNHGRIYGLWNLHGGISSPRSFIVWELADWVAGATIAHVEGTDPSLPALAQTIAAAVAGNLILAGYAIDASNSPFGGGVTASGSETGGLVHDEGLAHNQVGGAGGHMVAAGGDTVGWNSIAVSSAFRGMGEIVLAMSGSTLAGDLPTDCELVPLDSFGMAPQQGDSLAYYRADTIPGTPALGGVSTVPIDGANEPDVGDILAVTAAASPTTATAAWKAPADLGLATEAYADAGDAATLAAAEAYADSVGGGGGGGGGAALAIGQATGSNYDPGASFSNAKVALSTSVTATGVTVDLTNDRLVAQTAGWYLVRGHNGVAGNGEVIAAIYKNGSAVNAASQTIDSESFFVNGDASALVYLAVGDYVELWGCYQGSGGYQGIALEAILLGTVGTGSPDDPPPSPNAKDDEFDGSSSVSWTQFETPAAFSINSLVPNRLYIRTPTGSPQQRLVGGVQAVPSFPFTVTTKVASHGAFRNFHRAGGLVFLGSSSPGTSDDRVYFGFTNVARRGDGSTLAADQGPMVTPNRILYSDRSTFGTEAQGPGGLGAVPFYYVRATLASATSITSEWSLDGIHWATLETAYNPGFSVTHVGLGLASEYSGGGTHDEIAATFDWIRFS